MPLLVRWPEKIKAGAVSDQLTILYDLLPTFAELAGVQLTAPTDGLSIAPTLLGRGLQPKHNFLYWEMPARLGSEQVVRQGGWKLHLFPGKKPRELYDLENDPAESQNVAATQAAVVEALSEIATREHSPERKYQPDTSSRGAKDYVK